MLNFDTVSSTTKGSKKAEQPWWDLHALWANKDQYSLLDATKQFFVYAKFIKDLCIVKRTLDVQDKAFFMEQTSSII